MPSCWGRGGSTWGPQVAPALRQMRVPAMVYPFTHTERRAPNTHYFCDTLCYDRLLSAASTPSSPTTPPSRAAWERHVSHSPSASAAGARLARPLRLPPGDGAGQALLGLPQLQPRHQHTAGASGACPSTAAKPSGRWRRPTCAASPTTCTRLPGVQVRTIRDAERPGGAAAHRHSAAADLVARASASAGSDAMPTDDPLLSPGRAALPVGALARLGPARGQPALPLRRGAGGRAARHDGDGARGRRGDVKAAAAASCAAPSSRMGACRRV